MEPVALGSLSIRKRNDGWVTLADLQTAVELHFNPEEWSAFISGVKAGEFAWATLTESTDQ